MAQRFYTIFLLLLGIVLPMQGNTSNGKPGHIRLTKPIKSGLNIRSHWLYSNDDQPLFSLQHYNDSSWISVSSELLEEDQLKNKFKGRCWMRMHFHTDSLFDNKPYAFCIEQKGASEIYLNGKLIRRIGNYGGNDERSIGENELILVQFLPNSDNVIAIRYENMGYDHTFNTNGEKMAGFTAELFEPDALWKTNNDILTWSATYGMGLFAFFFSIGLVHFLLFLFYQVRRSNLLFAVFCAILSFYFLHIFLTFHVYDDPDSNGLSNLSVLISIPLFLISILSVIYSLFLEKNPKFFKYLFWAAVVSSITLIISVELGFLICAIIILILPIELSRILIMALRKKLKGSKIIAAGFSMFILFILSFFLFGVFNGGNFGIQTGTTQGYILLIMLMIAIVSIPLSMSIFLAWDFAGTNKTLQKKLEEVQILSEKTVEQEKEKQKILSEQNELLERQVEERTSQINEQKKLIEEKNKDITDSINYAQRIQRSILPTAAEIEEIFPQSFVLFKPRDIVSGDFYQFKKLDEYNLAIMADCTGHGVPGALMSMIGSNLLQQIIIERKICRPDRILFELNLEVKNTLRQSTEYHSHDGMDASIALLVNNKLFISSANRPVYVINNDKVTEIKPDKRSIGGSSSLTDEPFTIHEIEVEPGMMLYMFSDGYADQFGGEQGKKFKLKNLQDLLIKNYNLPVKDQLTALDQTFQSWKNSHEQVDDVCVMGIRF